MTPVHLVEIANEEGGFVPPRAGPEFHDTPAAIGVAVIGTEVEEIVPLLRPPGPEIWKLCLGEAFELRIVSADQGVELGDLPLAANQVLHLFLVFTSFGLDGFFMFSNADDLFLFIVRCNSRVSYPYPRTFIFVVRNFVFSALNLIPASLDA
jgi:hypothetical protein